ncbi:MAG: hypothetical protein J0M12_17100 [Deltaproteobacteria bacterium]|nr:hypothetical protein [Deltaproteobacteria bacterium]
MIDLLVYIVVRGFVSLLNLLPLRSRISLMTGLVRTVTAVLPAFKRVSLRNLELAFPEKDSAWRHDIIRQSQSSLARVIVDFARLEELDEAWVRANVDCAFLPRFEEMKAANPGKGIMIATGHLGSFELLAHCVAMYGYPISFVVRPFKLPKFNAWWTGIREAAGNRAIMRKGAFKEVVADLSSGRDVAILFDQNVTRKHAVFVDWFGRPAATTRTVALAALRTEAPVIVASMGFLGSDRYRISACECDFQALYADETISADEKVLRMTQELSKRYEDMIRQHPGEWFWMHKRWKTAPEGMQENFYKS